jgi:hypothetical protein
VFAQLGTAKEHLSRLLRMGARRESTSPQAVGRQVSIVQRADVKEREKPTALCYNVP